jgi:hypothetical protein
MTDEEYVQLMVKKEAKKKLAKSKKEPILARTEGKEKGEIDIKKEPENCTNCYYCIRVLKIGDSLLCACTNNERLLETRFFEYKWWVISQEHPGCWKSPVETDVDAGFRQKTEPVIGSAQESDEKKSPTAEGLPATSGLAPRKPPEMVTELDPETEMALTFLRDEVISSSSKRKALATIEKYRKDPPAKRDRKKKAKSATSEKISPVKSCQNCYFCAAQRSISGSIWCHCTNPGRSTEATATGKSWVKSQLNLPCWKPPRD